MTASVSSTAKGEESTDKHEHLEALKLVCSLYDGRFPH
jgi:hypothetical protein